MNDRVAQPSHRSYSAAALAGFLGATFLVAGVSSAITISAIPTWYATLAKPTFNPPNSIFGPVWTVLYALMAIAAWLVWRQPDSTLRRAGLIWFGIQLVVNFLWSMIFFHFHHIGLAMLEIGFLWLLVAGTTAIFFRVSKPAGWMFVPYLAWVSFASLLNFSIWRMN
jgi:benzodiazapine receptor